MAKQLEHVGLTREQAETHIQIMTEVMESNLATKFDIMDTKADIQSLRNEMIQMEYRLMIRLGILFTSVMTLGFTAVSLVIKFH